MSTAVTFDQRIKNVVDAIGTKFKDVNAATLALQSAIADEVARVGALPTLTTDQKGSIVAAINELKGQMALVPAAVQALIADGAVAAHSTYSSQKINDLVNAKGDQIVQQITGGALPGALDTLLEITTLLASNDNALSGLLAVQAKSVRVDIVQPFTVDEKSRARTNIGAANHALLIDHMSACGDFANSDYVVRLNAAIAA